MINLTDKFSSETQFIDGFEIGDKAVISDPCYSLKLNASLILENVMPGRWDCSIRKIDVGEWGIRTAELSAINQAGTYRYPDEYVDTLPVDAGLMCISDYDYYCENDGRIAEDNVSMTAARDFYGDIIPGDRACVAISGVGDGSYPVYVHTNSDGIIDGIRIEFINNER